MKLLSGIFLTHANELVGRNGEHLLEAARILDEERIAVDAVLYESDIPLKQLMKLKVGDTLPLEMRADASHILTSRHIPQPGVAVAAGGGQRPPVRAERDRVERVRAGRHGRADLARP